MELKKKNKRPPRIRPRMYPTRVPSLASVLYETQKATPAQIY
ncbi:hypothetical protein CpipJ_CPIJ017062 [Culex quinquefasciatus]|uniref:Uncharacterized protein n=1 Tax=Culex quinquefasciatus TaxID=7176 RepID=B0XC93_CULQU|nr:hypothetical protein CpipJ_CPIJ017062 [Culex quinquefasciatus]|eukprot:XP_001867265.1 hypothetical protein CpipJ_CPIJ017062 [Culex quinquefasciatus]